MTTAAPSHDVYYKYKYWNDHPRVLNYLIHGLRFSHEKKPVWWTQYFWEQFLSKKKLGKALFINCGNGWVERELFDMGIFEEGIGFDFSENLLEEARKAAEGRSLSYIQADCNKVDFPENSFDLVVNVAAMHHVQYIDRLNRIIAKSLKPTGFYLNYEYVGPHRNQYSESHWRLLEMVNQTLPQSLRASTPLDRPSIDNMLREDPTEAIHSELILNIFDRYFHTLERKDLGGGIAYQLMYNNFPLFTQSKETDSAVEHLVTLDELFTSLTDLPTLFSYFVGTPRKKMFNPENSAQLESFTKEEEEREKYAAQHGGRYQSETPEVSCLSCFK